MTVNNLAVDIYIDDLPEYSTPYLAVALVAYLEDGPHYLNSNYLSLKDLAEALKPYLTEIDTKG
jgi:hypothetical protein